MSYCGEDITLSATQVLASLLTKPDGAPVEKFKLRSRTDLEVEQALQLWRCAQAQAPIRALSRCKTSSASSSCASTA